MMTATLMIPCTRVPLSEFEWAIECRKQSENYFGFGFATV